MFGQTASVKRNVLASWVAHGVTIVVGFFLMPYVVRVLGDQAYGSWVFINSMASYAGLLYFGFGDTISRYVAKYHGGQQYGKINQIVTLVLAIYLAMGVVALMIGGVLCAAAPYLSNWEGARLSEIRLTILVLALNVSAGLAGSVFGGVLIGLRRFDLERGVSFCSDISRLVLILVFLRSEWGILTIALIYLAITVMENLAYLIMAFRALPELRVKLSLLNWETFRESSSFSSMAFLNAIAYQMTNATDSVVIGFALGTDKIVPYYIALRLTQFIRQPIDKISQICMPTAGALSAGADQSKLHRFLLQAFGTVFLLSAGVFIGAWFFGDDVIAAWMGERYEQSHYLFVVLLGAQMVSLPCGVLRAFLFGLGSVRAPAIIYLAEAVCNLTLSILLVQLWGQSGVAWGTTIPVCVLELGLLLPLALKIMKLSFRRLWNEALVPQFLPLASLAVYSWVVSTQQWGLHAWPLLIAVTAGGGLVLGSIWLVTTGRRLPGGVAA